MKKQATCSVCECRKSIGADGLMRPHKRHGVACDGAGKPPQPRKVRPTDAWSAARRATLKRDEHRCRKCLAGSGLEVHHIIERVHGGTNDLDNLITLCSDCHCEWTFCQPSDMAFDVWRRLPPARWLVHVFAKEWPADISAAAFKENIINTIALAMAKRLNG